MRVLGLRQAILWIVAPLPCLIRRTDNGAAANVFARRSLRFRNFSINALSRIINIVLG